MDKLHDKHMNVTGDTTAYNTMLAIDIENFTDAISFDTNDKRAIFIGIHPNMIEKVGLLAIIHQGLSAVKEVFTTQIADETRFGKVTSRIVIEGDQCQLECSPTDIPSIRDALGGTAI